MAGRVTTSLGGGPGSISQVRDRLELLREPVDPPRLGIDAGGHGISYTQVLAGDCRRVYDQGGYENNDGHDAQRNDQLMFDMSCFYVPPGVDSSSEFCWSRVQSDLCIHGSSIELWIIDS